MLVGFICTRLLSGDEVGSTPTGPTQYNMPPQLNCVKLRPLKARIKGSSPFGGTYASMALMVAQQTLNLSGLGSSPSRGTNIYY